MCDLDVISSQSNFSQ